MAKCHAEEITEQLFTLAGITVIGKKPYDYPGA